MDAALSGRVDSKSLIPVLASGRANNCPGCMEEPAFVAKVLVVELEERDNLNLLASVLAGRSRRWGNTIAAKARNCVT